MTQVTAISKSVSKIASVTTEETKGESDLEISTEPKVVAKTATTVCCIGIKGKLYNAGDVTVITTPESTQVIEAPATTSQSFYDDENNRSSCKLRRN